MATAVSMPKLGMTMEEGVVIAWPLEPGSLVEKGDIVLVIESEKAEVEIEAPASGVVRKIYIEAGETVPCGTLLAAITDTADEPFDAHEFHAAEDRSETKDNRGLELTVAVEPKLSTASPGAVAQKPIVPAARAAARKLGIDPQGVSGTGPNGRVTKQDVEAYAKARESLVSVGGGVALDVLTSGKGDAVVLLPGLGTDASAFARQTPLLAEGFQVHGVNPRGVGLSDSPLSESYEVVQTAADATATYSGTAHIIGASLGAAAALELALNHPERVKTLTLITPFVEVSPRLRAVAEGWRRMAGEVSPETLAAALLPWFFSANYLVDGAARDRTLRGLAQTVSRVPAITLDRMIAGMLNWSHSRIADLSGISVPTLVVSASEDLLVPDSDFIASEIPGATLLVVEGAGHAVALESPDAVNEAIMAHLGHESN
jgi:3-oxoadipate enol-lactonase